ncbi:MAG: type II secretion system protein [Candidatus Babeliales bacterium]|jgi:prepilin-type N-terminal cleavage/methylation domain-containing protein
MDKQAFSLIELMIVVAIIAFLATVSVPQYLKYQAKARQAEVAVNLASLHTAMQAYFIEHGSYTNVLNGEGGIGWKPEGYSGGGKNENFYYTYGFNFAGAQEGVHYFTGKLETSKDSMGQCSVEGGHFVAKASGDVYGKGKSDVWTMNESRKLVHEVDGLE